MKNLQFVPMARTNPEPPDLQTPGGRLRWAREAWGLSSARAAAQRFGWNENTYKSHEQGMRGAEGFKINTAKKYARALNVSVDWLMTGVGSPNLKTLSPAEREWAEMTDEERALAIRLLKAASSA